MGFEALRATLLAQRKDLVEHIALGGAADYAAYCKAVGAVQALDRVLLEISEIEKTLED